MANKSTTKKENSDQRVSPKEKGKKGGTKKGEKE